MRTLKTTLTLLLILAAFLMFNLASTRWFKGERIDLTENHLYTLSEGSRHILASLDKPIELTFYFSDKLSKDLPSLRGYARRVQELLQEYEAASHGQLKLKIIDPEPFSEAEDQATASGLQAVPASQGGDSLYFGLVGRNVAGNEEVIPFFQLDKEQFLEYELTKLIYNLHQTKRPVVAVLSGLQINGGFDMMSQSGQPAWVIVQQLEDLFELRWLPEDIDTLDDDIDVLLLVHPKALTEKMQFAIDQYVMRGGKAMIFVDPVAETDRPAMPMMGASFDNSSDLEPLFKAWGVQMRKGQVVGDFSQSLVVGVGPGRDPVRHLALLGLKPAAFNTDDVVLAGLESINMSSVGILEALPGAKTQLTPLLLSSPESSPLDAAQFAHLTNPETLFDNFEAKGEVYTLAARLTGPADTAFANGVEGLQPKYTHSDHLNLILVADTDVLSDRLWVQIQNFFGQNMATPWADNSAFVVNALENLSGSIDLISVRSRGRFSRPFEVVDELQRQAEERFRESEQNLRDRLSETESKLAELQNPQGDQETTTLTEEQHQALLQFQQEKLKIRKQLRDVQHELNKDIESLGRDLKLINILLVPVVLTVLALVMLAFRRRPRSVKRTR